MCLYPKLIRNPKYRPNKKNNYNPPEPKDPRVKWVPVGCGKCMECRKQKANHWRIRLLEEIRANKGIVVSLTFNTETLTKYNRLVPKYKTDKKGNKHIIDGYDRENEICKIAVRRFLERWRNHNGKSVKHWFVTELGGGRYEHIHLHGFIFTENIQGIHTCWGKHGFVWIGDYCNDQSVSYFIKYFSKQDHLHETYLPKIFCSPGIGGNFMNRKDWKKNIYDPSGETNELYTSRSGSKMGLPIYFRNKIYSEEERENLWINKMDQMVRYVDGHKIDISSDAGWTEYYAVLEDARRKNARLGYGDDSADWELEEYERNRRNLLFNNRISNID